MYRRPTFSVSVGLPFKLISSFYKDYIQVQRAIPKSLRLEYQPSLLGFGPQGNTQISYTGFSTGRNSCWTFYQYNLKFCQIGLSTMTHTCILLYKCWDAAFGNNYFMNAEYLYEYCYLCHCLISCSGNTIYY